MSRSVLQVLVLLVLVVLLGGTVVIAGDNEFSRKTLAGLLGVNVCVEEVKPPLERSTIQTDVELRLRRAGIRVLSEEERLKTPGSPWLYVLVTHVGDNLVAYRLDVDLRQAAVLAREPQVSSPGVTTWSASGVVGIVGKHNLVDTVRKDVRDKVDTFINAYLSVNPYVKPGPQPDDDEDTPKPQKKLKKKAPKPAVTEEQ